MNFSEFSKNIYQRCATTPNQGKFVFVLTTSAGNKYFIEMERYTSDATEVAVFAGKTKFSANMASSFQKTPNGARGTEINEETFVEFIDKYLSQPNHISKAMTAFGIPIQIEQNKKAFINALCIQFQSIIANAPNDVENIVPTEYGRLLQEVATSGMVEINVTNLTPIYPGDHYVCESPAASVSAKCYDIINHTWTIKNIGTVAWEGRYLECTQKGKARDTSHIEIPKLNPGEATILNIKINAGQFEGIYDTIWEIMNSQGEVCFPNKSGELKLTVDVHFVDESTKIIPTKLKVATRMAQIEVDDMLADLENIRNIKETINKLMNLLNEFDFTSSFPFQIAILSDAVEAYSSYASYNDSNIQIASDKAREAHTNLMNHLTQYTTLTPNGDYCRILRFGPNGEIEGDFDEYREEVLKRRKEYYFALKEFIAFEADLKRKLKQHA